MPVRDIRVAFENACRKAKIKELTFHDLRYTFNTNMRKAGVDKSVIMKFTGHKTSNMFLRYNTVDEGDAKDAVRRLGQFLCGQKEDECSHSAPTPFSGQKRGTPESP